MAEQKKIKYFGYGANRELAMMQAIIGKKGLVGTPATLKDFELCVQKLEQIPDKPAEDAPAPLSPRHILKDNWPETFESYIIRPKEGSEVAGTLWELEPLDRALVRDWELIDFGWYRDLRAKATTQEGAEVEVETEGLREDQEVDRVVDGLNYESWLMKPEDFARIAEKSREEYN